MAELSEGDRARIRHFLCDTSFTTVVDGVRNDLIGEAVDSDSTEDEHEAINRIRALDHLVRRLKLRSGYSEGNLQEVN